MDRKLIAFSLKIINLSRLKCLEGVVSIDLFLSHFYSFLYDGVYYHELRLSARDVIVSKTSYNGE